MIYVLDTDILTISEQQDSDEFARLSARVAQLDPGDSMVTTIVTYEEQTRGWLSYAAKSHTMPHQIKAYARLKRHLLTYLKLDVLDFDDSAGQEFDRLRAIKLRLGTQDLKIAAIALSQDATLLSRNLADFRRVPNLRVEDWTKP